MSTNNKEWLSQWRDYRNNQLKEHYDSLDESKSKPNSNKDKQKLMQHELDKFEKALKKSYIELKKRLKLINES